jgi:hypothetical protein
MLRRVSALAIATLLIAGCEGPMGPEGPAGATGPAGPQGIQGPAGPAGVANRSVLILAPDEEGVVVAQLPQAAGSTAGSPPFVSCYIGQQGSAFWEVFSDGWQADAPFCGLFFVPEETRWYAFAVQIPAEFVVAFIVIF